LLYLNFRDVTETFIILLSIPFAMTGSFWILWLLDFHLSIAVWVGIIALAGLAAQTGMVMIVYLDEAFHAYQRAGRMRTQHDLFEAITYGAVQRVRPKLMTVAMVTLGLVPALWAHGAGAEAIQRIAAPMIGGLITSTILTLELVPAIYSLWRGRQVAWVKGPPPPRKSWEELSRVFTEMERAAHGASVSGTTHLPESGSEACRVEGSQGASERQPGTAVGRVVRPRWLRWMLLGTGLALLGTVAWWWRHPATPGGPASAETGPALITEAAPEASLPAITLAQPQQRSLMDFLSAAAAAAASLSADRVDGFVEVVPRIQSTLERTIQELGSEHPWHEALQRVAQARLASSAASLEEARESFLPFSVSLVDFAKTARRQCSSLASLKIYRCPMAPKPGVWLQLEGPLRNPYFGSEMLECGVEVP
jgi:hypothetical protein